MGMEDEGRKGGAEGGVLLDFCQVGLDGMNPLHLACSQGSSRHSALTCCQVLCELDSVDLCALNGQGRTAIHIAGERGDMEAARYLFGKCPQSAALACNIGQNALQRAAAFGRLPIVQLLVKAQQIDLNAKNNLFQILIGFSNSYF